MNLGSQISNFNTVIHDFIFSLAEFLDNALVPVNLTGSFHLHYNFLK